MPQNGLTRGWAQLNTATSRRPSLSSLYLFSALFRCRGSGQVEWNAFGYQLDE